MLVTTIDIEMSRHVDMYCVSVSLCKRPSLQTSNDVCINTECLWKQRPAASC